MLLRAFILWARENRVLYLLLVTAALLLVILVIRGLLHLWFNRVRARIAGTYTRPPVHTFPRRRVDVLAEIARAERDEKLKGSSFIGTTPVRRGMRWHDDPVFLTELQRSMHLQVIGQTGSGKTQSVLFVLALQDILRGKGVIG